MTHKISEAEISDYLHYGDHWIHLAASFSSDRRSRKILEVNLLGVFRVKTFSVVQYHGNDLKTAVELYNKLP